MHQAPLTERIDFYKYSSATQFLDQARDILIEIRGLNRADTPDWKYNGLWTAFFATYGKPFKQQRDKILKIGLRLPDDVIPADHRSRHDAIIDLRDKMFAHTDFASFKDDQQQPLNALAVYMIEGMPNFAVRYILPRNEEIDNWIELLSELIATVAYRGTKIWKKWSRHIKVSKNSAWKINVSDNSNDIMIAL